MRHRRLILLGLALVALAIVLLVGWGVRGGDRSSTALDRSQETSSGHPVLLGPGAPDAQRAEASVGSDASDEQAAPPTVVMGTVHCDGQPVPSGRAFLTVPLSKFKPLASPRVEAAVAVGAFEIRVPASFFADDESIDISVGAVCPGGRKAVEELHLRRGESHHVHLEVPAGAALGGVVRDTEGNPVPGLEIVATTGRVAVSKSSRIFDSDVVLLSPRPHAEVRATTDALGRFHMDDAAPGDYGFATPSPQWMLNRGHIERHAPPASGIELLAVPAATLVVHARDAETGEPLDVVRVRLRADFGGFTTSLTCTCRNGKGDVTWEDRTRPLMQGGPAFSVAYHAEAFGYESASGSVEYGRDERAQTIEIALRRSPMGKIRLQVANDVGEPVSRPINVSCGRHVLFLEPTGAPGIYVSELPVGYWSIEVWPRGALGREQVLWRGSADVVENGTATCDVALEHCGSLCVEKVPEDRFLFQLFVGDSKVTTVLKRPRHEYAAVLEGTWAWQICALRSDTALQSGIVEIRRGTQAVIRVEPE